MNQQDKQNLLELAALAGGIQFRGYDLWYEDFSAYDQEIDCNYQWNPLDNDGDALRLAVKLKLEIYHAWDEVTQVCVGYPNVGKGRTNISYVIESYKDTNILEATRRAIVRAVAEIGKSMKVH